MSWIRDLMSRRQIDRDLDDEIQQHLDEKIDGLVSQGMSRESALLAAHREFGNVAHLQERGRDVWRWQPVEEFFADLRFAIRQLRKAGESLRDIAAELNRRGIKTKEGRPWLFTTIKGILNRVA